MIKNNFLKFLVLIIGVLALCVSCTETNVKVVNNNKHPGIVNLRGANVVAGEIAWKGEGVPIVSGTHYQFLKPADIDYLISKKINFIRLVYSWEYLQPTLNTDFPDTEYNRKFTETVNYATSKGLFVMVEPHGAADPNFWRYKGNAVGSPQVPISAFADFWKRMAWKFGNNWRVSYGLGNEPHGIPTITVFQAQQAAIDAIRKTTSRQMIFAELNHFDHIYTLHETWTDPTGQMTNAQGMLMIKDPINNTVFQFHEYFGTPGGTGSNSNVENTTIVVDRIKRGVDFARQHNLKLYLGEIGADSANPLSRQAVINVLDYINENSDVILGWSWWAAGDFAWWGPYRFSLLTTKNNTPDDVKWSWLSPYLAGLNSASPTLPLPIADAGAPDAGTLDAGTQTDAGTCALVVVSRTTKKVANSFCQEFDVINKCANSLRWQTAVINMGDATISSTKPDVWNVDAGARTGTLELSAPAWMQNVQPKTKHTFGLCATFGSSKSVAKFIELK